MNVDMICWECDYPHSDSTWPQSPEAVHEADAGRELLDDEEIDKISHANAMRLYKYDPFTTLGRQAKTAPSARCGPRPKAGT